MPPSQNGTLTPHGWLQWIAVVAVAATMGVGSAYMLPKVQPDHARPDPFTGTMGRELRADLMAYIHRMDTEGSLPVRTFASRIDALEARNAETISRLQRIEELLIEMRVRLGRLGVPATPERGM